MVLKTAGVALVVIFTIAVVVPLLMKLLFF